MTHSLSSLLINASLKSATKPKYFAISVPIHVLLRNACTTKTYIVSNKEIGSSSSSGASSSLTSSCCIHQHVAFDCNCNSSSLPYLNSCLPYNSPLSCKTALNSHKKVASTNNVNCHLLSKSHCPLLSDKQFNLEWFLNSQNVSAAHQYSSCFHSKETQVLMKTSEKTLSKKDEKEQPADDPRQKILLLKETLRSDLPGFFDKKKKWHDFSLYTDTIEFNVAPLRDVNANYKLKGMTRYKYSMRMLRRSLLLYLSHPSLDVIRIVANVEKRTIEVRWKISGWTPLSFISNIIMKMSNTPWEVNYMSTLYIDSDTKIWRHDVEQIEKLDDLPPLPRLRNILKQRAYAVYTSVTERVYTTFLHRDLTDV